MKNLFATIIICIFFSIINYSYAQYPDKRNVKIVKSETKNFLKAKGFTYLKASNNTDWMEEIDYSEEFSVVFLKNKYDNVTAINLSTNNLTIFRKLKNFYYSNKWTYIESNINKFNQALKTYQYKEYKIDEVEPQFDQGVTHYQFTINFN